MKTDKTKLLQDIEAMKEKLASMEEELNKPEEFKHFPSTNDKYYYYTPIGYVWDNTATDNDLRVNIYKTKEEAKKAYNKAVALEKVKRRILELQGDWKPDWTDENKEKHCMKYCIKYNHYSKSFIPTYWFTVQENTPFSYIKNEDVALIIIKEMKDELKLIFDIA